MKKKSSTMKKCGSWGHPHQVPMSLDETGELIVNCQASWEKYNSLYPPSAGSNTTCSLVTNEVQWNIVFYDLPITHVQPLEGLCTKYLKKLLEVTTSITTDIKMLVAKKNRTEIFFKKF